MDNLTIQLRAALWRYVSGDICDCQPDDGGPCHYCEGWEALRQAGVFLESGLTEPGRWDWATGQLRPPLSPTGDRDSVQREL